MNNNIKFHNLINNYENNKSKFFKKEPSRNSSYRTSNQPGFVCPCCKSDFLMKFGKFGKMVSFEQPTYYCLDCCKKNYKFVEL